MVPLFLHFFNWEVLAFIEVISQLLQLNFSGNFSIVFHLCFVANVQMRFVLVTCGKPAAF